jgi:hypothetical protein
VKASRRERKIAEVSPVTVLAAELGALRRDLRATIRAYAARLEVDLAESTAAVTPHSRAENLTREQLHEIRELSAMLRKRKVKPEKGRRKDLRKLDTLIREIHSLTHPGASQEG